MLSSRCPFPKHPLAVVGPLGLLSSPAPNSELEAANTGAPPLLPPATSKPKPEAGWPSSELEVPVLKTPPLLLPFLLSSWVRTTEEEELLSAPKPLSRESSEASLPSTQGPSVHTSF